MIENTKCECGHNNPIGTILCEYCGKPLLEETKEKKTIEQEMRYEGKARRSQIKHKNFIDQVWSFFSSVKVAIILILITLIAAGIGSLLPQERVAATSNPELFYSQEYGIWGEWFYKLGLSDMYNSWWFMTLLAMIGVSLVICSLDRVIPLYRALKNQKVEKSTDFLLRQRISYQESVADEKKEEKFDALTTALKKRRYQIRQEGDSILAEKGRISRWGPYINHIGLIIFLLGVLLRFLIPGWYLDQAMYIQEGQTRKVPDTPYYVKNEKFIVEQYDGKFAGIPKKYQTKLILYQQDSSGNLKPVHRGSAIVNHPFEYKDLFLVQVDAQTNLKGIKLKLMDKKSQQSKGTFLVDLGNIKPNQVYTVGSNLEVRALEYYPDFALENGRPITKSQEVVKPAFIFEVKEKGQKEGERSWVISGENADALTPENKYVIKLAGFEMIPTSGLLVRIDKSLPIIFVGGFICLIGLAMGFYWHHRRVWIRYKDGVLYLGAHTNKSWFSLRRELNQVGKQSGIDLKLVQE
ncbi:cytochrome c biogenesis protein ResB [Thermoflavimicrobium daqui]|jgi:cytochrome c biogenesis protein|uniref:Cytochrome C biogenesis protein n=1 Tax=Thermoflavimicrobium daqui TaxID=2137476 RepID=A0A364K2U8_9BACL|nr:cytochrome c biogenesis protein ResB [Thermoflavimicrobium daqui]RAL22671.1 cytochrome C biogenesis protein [Thermoflavimicrobium daqui]